MINTAANEARGILFKIKGIVTTAANKNIPWDTAAIFVFPPELTLAVVLTITEVIGKPPNKPLSMLPTPWAFNSVLVFVYRFKGSNLSAASIQSNVSILATAAIVNATTHTSVLPIWEKSGKLNCDKKPAKLSATGRLTR